MIRARQLTKQFGARPVLRGLDLDVQPGRITAIVGPNGSGKSTLIKAVLGLVKPDGGSLHVGDDPVNGIPAYRACIGYMPQIPRFPENLTANEVLALLGDLRGDPASLDTELIDRFGLTAELDKRLGTLSAGTRQKVNAVIAFLFRPELLILDEPTAGLDPVASAILKDKVHRVREEGRTIVLTTHVMSEVAELADYVVFLLDGKVRFLSSPGDVLTATDEPTLERGIARLMREATAA
jgi:Cu-processing system ATP-binding protein